MERVKGRKYKVLNSIWKTGTITVVLALGLSGCGFATHDSAVAEDVSGYYEDNYYDASDYDYEYGYDESYDYGMNDSVSADYDGEYVTEGQSTGLQTVQEENQGAKLIRSVYISFDTEQFDDAVTLIEQKTSQAGGYIQSSELYDYSYGRSQEIVVRVPYEKVDEFLNGIDVYGTITHKSDSV